MGVLCLSIKPAEVFRLAIRYLAFGHCHVYQECRGQEHGHLGKPPDRMTLKLIITVDPSVDPLDSGSLFIKTLPFMAAPCHRYKDPDVFIATDLKDTF